MSGRNSGYEETVSLGPQAAPSLERAAVGAAGRGVRQPPLTRHPKRGL